MTRREFVGSAALAAMGTGLADAGAAAARPNLRVGILSDIHCHHKDAVYYWKRALGFFREADVDAVLVAGDLFTYGKISELEDVARTWFEVFP